MLNAYLIFEILTQLLTCITGQLLPEYLPGIPAYDIHSTSSNSSLLNENYSFTQQCKNNSRLDCDGCHKQIVCDYEGRILARINCPPTRPYCSKSSSQCITTPSEECFPFINSDTIQKSDLCPSSGFFPDPLHCNKFNYCTSELRAVPYVCPHYYVYDPVSHLCKIHRIAQDCPTINCFQFPNSFVSYTLDRSLYVFCSIDLHGNARPLLYQCGSETIFDVVKQGCEFGCIEGEGCFEYPGDKKKYYLCLMTSYGEIVPFVMNCDNGSRFEQGKCKVLERNVTEVTSTTEPSSTVQHAIAFVPITLPIMQNNSNIG